MTGEDFATLTGGGEPPVDAGRPDARGLATEPPEGVLAAEWWPPGSFQNPSGPQTPDGHPVAEADPPETLEGGEPGDDASEFLAAVEAARTHEEMDRLVQEEDLILPADWSGMTLGDKRDWINALHSAEI